MKSPRQKLLQTLFIFTAALFVLKKNASLLPQGKRNFQESSTNIFFVETNDNLTQIHPRILCAVESAALYNPNSKIFLVLSDQSGVDHNISWLHDRYSNIHFEKVNFSDIMKLTPLYELWSKGDVQNSKYYLNNISNLLRLALLYVYGGTYLDTDVVSLKEIPMEPKNFIVAQSSKLVNTAVLKFGSRHRFLDHAMKSVLTDFKGDTWGQQGPFLATRVVKDLCYHNASTPDYAELKNCSDFFILPPDHAYGVSYVGWKLFFEENTYHKVVFETRKSFAVHYWDYMRRASRDDKIRMKENQNLYQLFQKHCPVSERYSLRPSLGQFF